MDNQHTLQPKSMTFYAAFTADRYARLWRQHTAGQSRDGFQTVSGWVGRIRGINFTIGLLYEPLGVRTVTTRTFPSCPGYTSVTRAKGHLVGIVGSSRRYTMSSTCRFCVGLCHFDNRFRVIKYSFDHRFQKWIVSLWQRFHLRSMLMGWRDSDEFGKAIKVFPIRKCPGVSTSNPSTRSNPSPSMKGRNTISLLERGKGFPFCRRFSSVENTERCISLIQNLSAPCNSSVVNTPLRRVWCREL